MIDLTDESNAYNDMIFDDTLLNAKYVNINNVDVPSQPPSLLPRCFKCHECPFITLRRSEFNRHVTNNEHRGDNRGTIKCFGCENVFHAEKSIICHLVLDHCLYETEICEFIEFILIDRYPDGLDEHFTTLTRSLCEFVKVLFGKNERDDGAETHDEEVDDKKDMKVDFDVNNTPFKIGIVDIQTLKRPTNPKITIVNIETLRDGNKPGNFHERKGGITIVDFATLKTPPKPAISTVNIDKLRQPLDKPEQQQTKNRIVLRDDLFSESKASHSQTMNFCTSYGQTNDEILNDVNVDASNLSFTHDIANFANVLDLPDVGFDPFKDAGDEEKITNVENKETKNVTDSETCALNKETTRKDALTCARAHCSIHMNTVDNLHYHMRCHANETRTFRCPECHVEFHAWPTIANHLWRAHAIDMNLHACHVCPYKTYSLANLTNVHAPIHENARDHTCAVCAKSFKTKKQLRNHAECHKQETHACLKCHVTYKSAGSLRNHARKVHASPVHACDACEFQTKTRASLTRHKRRHASERPYKCSMCAYTANDRNALARHVRGHTNVMKYTCELCEFACIQSKSYVYHVRRKHARESARFIFTCEMCAFVTLKRALLDAHVRRKHAR